MGDLGDLFDDDEADDYRTVVDTSFWNQPAVPDYPPLAHFGRFEILGRIARGGMAEIYLAREWDDAGKARHLVIKRVLPEMQDSPELLKMFLEEGEIAVRLYHQNICHVYECGEIESKTFMALEWVWGPQLQHALERMAARDSCIPWPIAVEIVAQVAAALHYVHHAKGVGGRPLNIIHRDVSPHNVIVSWGGAVKLLDFGIAKTSQDITTGGAAVGKYGYMSPEQAQSQKIDPRSDIFALGIVLFEALTSRSLYDRPTLLDTLSAIVREPVPSLLAERPELPEALEHIVQRALAKDPAHRFQSAGELRAALKSVLRTEGQVVTEQRIALFLDGLFDAREKKPLDTKSVKLTGSFEALTEAGAAAVRGESIAYETFDHSRPSGSPPPVGDLEIPIDLDELEKGTKRGSGWAAWVGLILLAFLMAGIGATVALYLLK